MTSQDREEFKAFCRNASNAQLQNIYWKEHNRSMRTGSKDDKEYASIALAEIRSRGRAKNNPMDPNTRILLTGSVLVAGAVGVALLFIGKKAAATPALPAATGNSYSLTPSNSGGTSQVHPGDQISIMLPQSASSGYSYQVSSTGSAAVLSSPQTTNTQAAETDTYSVVGTGSTTVTYQLVDSTGNASGTPITFTITSTAAALGGIQ